MPLLPRSHTTRLHYRTLDGQAHTWQPCDGNNAIGEGSELRARNSELELRLRWRECRGGLKLTWELRVLGTETLLLDQVLPAIVDGRWPLLADPAALRLFQNGYQSWTPSGSVAGDGRPPRPWLRSFSLMNHYVDSPFWGRRDGLSSSLFTLLRGSGEEEGVLVGFTGQRCGLGELFYQNKESTRLHCSLDYGGKRLEPGQVLQGEGLWLARGRPEQLLLAYAERAAQDMDVAPRDRARIERSPVGWCSWYQYYAGVREEDVLGNLAFLSHRPELGVEFFQLDDGYQRAVGDWLIINDKFPRGLAPLARDIRQQGFKAGIWTAPFFASPRSELFREHRDWFLRAGTKHSKRGLADCGYNPFWRCRLYALDLTHPDVLSWLGDTYRALVAAGYDYHKIDFLYAGLRHGERHDPSLSPVEAYRGGLRAIRDAIGAQRFLLGCGAPLGPSLGYFDGMRVSQDVKEQWDSWLASRAGRGCGYPSASGSLRSNLTRWFMHRRWWLNDPDCLLVRDKDSKLDQHETETMVSLLGMSGGMLFLSDELPALAPQRLAMAEAVLPPTLLEGRPADTMARHRPETVSLKGQGTRLQVLVNWSSKPVRRSLPDWSETETVFDFWGERILEPGALELARHGVRALQPTPIEPGPQLEGNSFHLAALCDGRLRSEFDEEKSVLRLWGRDMARREGRVWVRLPEGWTLRERDLPSLLKGVERWRHGVVLMLSASGAWSAALQLQWTGGAS